MISNYEMSNCEVTVKSVNFLGSHIRQLAVEFLNSGEEEHIREYNANKLLESLCKYFNINDVETEVVYGIQPNTQVNGRLKSKILGNYTVRSQRIKLFNLTAVKRKVVAIKTMYDTLLHEFMHHYDYEFLNLTQSVHSKGFYLRISDLKNKIGA